MLSRWSLRARLTVVATVLLGIGIAAGAALLAATVSRALQEAVDAGALQSAREVAALVDAGRRLELPLGELDTYMRSMRMDCDTLRIETRTELEGYMNGSAATVGRIMAPLLGAPPELREEFARLGVAFQLTNFIRDVRADWALDRVYLPREERARFGVSDEDIGSGRVTEGFRSLLALEVDRARGLFSSTTAAVDAVGPSVRPGMRLARAVYVRVLDRVEAIGFDVLHRRTRPWPWELGGAATGALRGARG